MIYESPMVPEKQSYYQKLASAVEAEAPAFLDHLLSREIASFNPSAHPPQTETKLELISMSRPRIAQEVAAMAEEGEYPFCVDLVRLQELREILRSRLGTKMPSQHEVITALRALNAINLETPIRTGKSTHRYWAWKNVEKWTHATHDEIRLHYNSNRLNLPWT